MGEQMRLSEAIRAGAKLRPQAFGGVFLLKANNRIASCALGAAFEGIQKRALPYEKLLKLDLRKVQAQIGKQWPALMEKPKAQCPKKGCTRHRLTLRGLIVHLSDHHRWTRNQIADWLESLGH